MKSFVFVWRPVGVHLGLFFFSVCGGNAAINTCSLAENNEGYPSILKGHSHGILVHFKTQKCVLTSMNARK